MKISSTIKQLYSFIQEHNISNRIINNTFDFHDEPHFALYNVEFNGQVKKELKDSGFISNTEGLSASGFSSFSQKLALLKCLMETLERFCLYTYLEENIYINSYSKLGQDVLNPSVYTNSLNIKDTRLGWIKGYTGDNESKILLPAQLVYINYHHNQKHNEPILSQLISTGAASGFTHEETLLRGIYEIIERDSFMTSYLNKVSLAKIDIKTILSKKIKTAIETLGKYWITPHIFYIENDFNIPTYLTVLVDNTPIGPEIAVGAKASLRMEYGILGSIEEAVFTRHSMRKIIHHYAYSTDYKIKPDNITTIDKRGLYWSKKNMKDHVAFLLNSTKEIASNNLINITQSISTEEELEKILSQIKQSDYSIYYADITLPQVKKNLGVTVYKVLIPGLQPLYLNEQEKEFMIDRLKRNAIRYGKEKIQINPIPHPFL